MCLIPFRRGDQNICAVAARRGAERRGLSLLLPWLQAALFLLSGALRCFLRSGPVLQAAGAGHCGLWLPAMGLG